MKTLAKKIVLKILKVLARRRLAKFKGKVIAITGSVGKTSTKEAIFAVLNTQYRVRRNLGSMNSDFGMLLTILDIKSGYNSATKWSWYLLKGFLHSFMRDASEVLVLEMGVDKPGDMDFLTSVVKPDLVVFTNVAGVHLAEGQFKDAKEVYAEKSKLLKALKDSGKALFNLDNAYTKAAYGEFDRERRVGYSALGEADFGVTKVRSSLEGIEFEVVHEEEKLVFRSEVLGRYQVYVLLPAIACGLLLKMSYEQIAEAVSRFKLPPGRMSLIEGIEGAQILDSSYNSSPFALREALGVLEELAEGRRKVAVLGSMNELGEVSQEQHEIIGEICVGKVDLLITVGKEAKWIADKALEMGMSPATVFKFSYAKEAAEFFKKHVKSGDLVLVKGSQNRVRLEVFVKELMLEPEKAAEVLVRQDWK
ncbi:UDP-N-acetylmuramoyl-tripeptide--D-alanyl-D-alanine ligase [Candidatus Gracilibacteria bacterium]|nr:UDP-N-acetylmuramoyl-tripeptide--D-alanyl-D-alanine ligase [Candidatus Gracilibacteria bacterium]